MSLAKDENLTSTRQILEAITDLHAQEQIVTRDKIGEVLPHLSLQKISDRLGYLIETSQISRPERGVYVPVITHATSRSVCKYILPDGTVKLEIGDQVVTMTPKESRYVGNLMVAEAMQFSNLELGHTVSIMQNQFADQMRRFEKKLEKVSGRHKEP